MVPSDKEECHEKVSTHLDESPEEVSLNDVMVLVAGVKGFVTTY